MTTLIREVHVQNFKSIADVSLSLGRVNVFIGENGCGKSNFLEALAFASAAAADKLDNEFLASRGIRVPDARFMRSAFADFQSPQIVVDAQDSNGVGIKQLINTPEADPYPRWISRKTLRPMPEEKDLLEGYDEDPSEQSNRAADQSEQERRQRIKAEDLELARFLHQDRILRGHPLRSFLIYTPENSALRTFAAEGQILPLGVRGAGLLRLLRVLSLDSDRWAEFKQNLRMLDWFGDIEPPPKSSEEQAIRIKDRFLAADISLFDQRSANEGFLFLLFYFALVISPNTPPFFAIDNVDTSLNPKTVTELTTRIAKLSEKHNKQVILTTHSPAVLDGLDLKDDEQRLFVFHRNRKGETRARRVMPPQPLGKEPPVKLSDAFMRGLLGGLPQNF